MAEIGGSSAAAMALFRSDNANSSAVPPDPAQVYLRNIAFPPQA
eukprot:CAMPEP_0172309636 /NCGR_PEP_ID=MMETSP1058-20130122/10302_1 /TAXON_ID=83371 /ORGANISM="Detonula confervacea, Strain CCMP 353" /LENGTH=43 /DNA_ID= /DNA_START= /DNA_END= /DNA_ORIENTATION=